MTTVTREWLAKVVTSNDEELVMHVIGRGLVVLFNNQTDSEKCDNQAKVDNLKGFSKPDARSGTLCAKYYLKHNKLEAWQIEKWKVDWKGAPRIAKYHRQLAEAADRKMKSIQYKEASR